MQLNYFQALASLIAHSNASNGPVNIGWDEVAQWQDGILNRFIDLGVLVKDVNTKSITCLGCEHNCIMEVLLTEDAKRAFIVCEDPDMQGHMGRISVPLVRLQQWRIKKDLLVK
jgi:hypothetical protein